MRFVRIFTAAWVNAKPTRIRCGQHDPLISRFQRNSRGIHVQGLRDEDVLENDFLALIGNRGVPLMFPFTSKTGQDGEDVGNDVHQLLTIHSLVLDLLHLLQTPRWLYRCANCPQPTASSYQDYQLWPDGSHKSLSKDVSYPGSTSQLGE